MIVFRNWHAGWFCLNRFSRNSIVGVLACIVAPLFHGTGIVGKLEKESFDWVMRMYVGTAPVASPQIRPITFIEIDERTYRLWGEPLYIPRGRLLTLLKYSVEGGAALIVVDVELTKETGAVDENLVEYLNQIARRPAEQVPQIFLSRGFRAVDRGTEQPDFEQRKSFLDEKLIANRVIHWAAPLFQVDDDHVIRRWKLWQAVCGAQKVKQESVDSGLASFQLLAAGLQGQKDNPLRIDAEKAVNQFDTLQGALDAHAQVACGNKATALTKAPTIELAGRKVDLKASGIDERITYTLPYRLRPHEAYPRIHWRDDPDYPLLSVKPAFLITEMERSAASEQQVLGHAVFIGASYNDSRDSFPTPIGMMPGALIIANSYLTLLGHGTTVEMPAIFMWPLRLLSVLLIAWIFSRANGFTAKLFANVAILAMMVPLSLWLFRVGIWFDFALPLAAIGINSHYAELEKNIGLKRGNES